MDTQATKIHQKLISFPDPIYSRLIKRSKKIGFSFSEYMRMMAVEHLKTPEPFEEIEILDQETSDRVDQSVKEIKSGKSVLLKKNKDIENYFNNILACTK